MSAAKGVRLATIDIGTNSVLLLVAELVDGALRPVDERATITRLGQGVDATGRLAAEAKARTLDCLRGYSQVVASHRVAGLAVVGTSAMRDADDGDFVARAEQVLGVAPEVISGQREAELTFDGAISGLDVAGEITVFDVGGGSTEIIAGVARPERSEIRQAVSLDIGAVRLTERLVRGDPPEARELQEVAAAVRLALAGAPGFAGPLVGVAGTVTTLAAHVLGVAPYDPRRVHGSVLALDKLRGAAEELAGMTLAERRTLATVDPKRADVIVAGAWLVTTLCEVAGVDRLVVSDRGVRWGLARSLAANLAAP